MHTQNPEIYSCQVLFVSTRGYLHILHEVHMKPTAVRVVEVSARSLQNMRFLGEILDLIHS